MSAARSTLTFKAVTRALEAAMRALLAPSMMAGVLVAFLALTYLAAALLAQLLDRSGVGVLVLWAATTALGVALVRQLPRILK